jgi:hypothetical protein
MCDFAKSVCLTSTGWASAQEAAGFVLGICIGQGSGAIEDALPGLQKLAGLSAQFFGSAI